MREERRRKWEDLLEATEEALEAQKSLCGRGARVPHDEDLAAADPRPAHIYSEDHVHAHVFQCMLAYHEEWYMRRDLAPILFEDDNREGVRARHSSPVEKTEVSESTKAKADTKRTPDGLPVHSQTTLPSNLATLMPNEVKLPGRPDYAFPLMAQPTEPQRRAVELLDIDLTKGCCHSGDRLTPPESAVSPFICKGFCLKPT